MVGPPTSCPRERRRLIVQSLFLLSGLALLIYGGEVLVRGASGISRIFRVSSLTTGLTVVAFGTSAPELAVNLSAAMHDSGGLSFGNVIGSNLANIGLVIGCAALLRPIPIRSQVARLEIPIMLFTSAVVVAFGFDRWFGALPEQYDRGEGLALLFLFALFVYYTFLGAQRDRRSNGDEEETAEDESSPTLSRRGCLMFTLVGLALLWAGGHLTVEGAMGLARSFHVSEAIIGITLVAVGTSLPELAASLAAIRNGQPDLVIGNVLGSNIFNVLLVLGATALLSPVQVPFRGGVDLSCLGLMSVLVLFASIFNQRRISRVDGLGLLALYVLYMTWRTLW